ncbi:MAG: PH domain-containing protein [Mangrovibacterium sp.]
MIKYPSKISWGIVAFLVVILGGEGIFMLINRAWSGLLVILLTSAFIVWLFRITYYLIDGNRLRIKSFFIINLTIEISTITKIEETNNPLSAPALSLDRLAIYHGKQYPVLVSPTDKAGFVHALKRINPAIQFIPKKKKRQG